MDKPTIKLNVGGKRFETTKKQTLSASKYFTDIILKYDNLSNEIFIDRSYDNFEHVLSLLRDTQHPFPKNIEYELEFLWGGQM